MKKLVITRSRQFSMMRMPYWVVTSMSRAEFLRPAGRGWRCWNSVLLPVLRERDVAARLNA